MPMRTCTRSMRKSFRVPAIALLLLAITVGLANCGSSSDDFNPTLFAVAFGNDAFVAVGQDSTIANSGDGSNFLLQVVAPLGSLLSLTYGNGVFVTSGKDGLVFTSVDTAFWFQQFINTTRTMRGATFGEGTYVLVGD